MTKEIQLAEQARFRDFRAKINNKSRKELEQLLFTATKSIAYLDDQNRALRESYSHCFWLSRAWGWLREKFWWAKARAGLLK